MPDYNRIAVTLSHMHLNLFDIYQAIHAPDRTIGHVMPEWHISMWLRARAAGPTSAREISRELGYSRDAVRFRLQNLIRDGLVVPIIDGGHERFAPSQSYIADKVGDAIQRDLIQIVSDAHMALQLHV